MRSLSAAAFLTAAVLCGCGGSSGDAPQASSASTHAGTTMAGAQAAAQQGEEKQQATPAVPATPPRQQSPEGRPEPGSKAVAPGVPTTEGGDNSIQSFGAEGEEDQRSQAYANLREYLTALRKGEPARACSFASVEFREELAKLIERAKVPAGQEKPQGCAQTLRGLTGGASKETLEEITRVGELLSFRARGKYAYLIYRGEGGKAMFIAMANDEGEWKVNVPRPEAFSATGQSQAGSEQ